MMSDINFSLRVQAGMQRAQMQSNAVQCCGSGACRNLKETSAIHPKNPALKIVSPDSAAWRLGGPWGALGVHWGREIWSGPWAMSRSRVVCYLDPHGVGMWLDEALDDRRREAIKIRSKAWQAKTPEAGRGSGRRRLNFFETHAVKASAAAIHTLATRRISTNRNPAFLLPLGLPSSAFPHPELLHG